MRISKEEVALRYERYVTFNAERIKAATEVMDKRTRGIFELVPLFLHYNDPRIPGYRNGNVPFGIDNFSPSEYQKNWLLKLGVNPDLPSQGMHTISSLYCMGSTASIGQGQASDLDLWVCVSSNLSKEEISLLKEKCSFINAYAASLGTDVNLFITPEDRFTTGVSGVMDTEDCGSAQSLFLLDEFYRSSIRLCGRCIIWYLVSPHEEQENYTEAVDAIIKSGFGKKDLWFDFGSVVDSSPAEYFGSGLWLLYKGIDSPFKAVLKSLLMEAYAADYPNVELVCQQLKRHLFKQGHLSLKEDAYFLMYRRVCSYLKNCNDLRRLSLVQHCFYAKVAGALSSIPDCQQRSMRFRLLRRLRKLWDRNNLDFDFTNDPETSDVSTVLRTEQELFDSFMKSYKALVGFSISHGIEYAITSDDAGILSRKLYAAYDCYSGKILRLSRSLGGSLVQKALTFIHTAQDRLCRIGWHVYPAAAMSCELLECSEIYACDSLTEAVLWTAYNGICGHETAFYCSGDKHGQGSGKIKKFSEYLISFLNHSDLKVDQKDLFRTRLLRDCLVVLNFEYDPTADAGMPLYDANEGSALSCGHDRRCLVGSVSTVTVNSWGEVNCHIFGNDEESLVELFAYLMRQNAKYEKDGGLLKRINFVSFSKNYSELIRYDLENVLRELSWCVYEKGSEYTFDIGEQTYTAKSVEKGGISITRHSPFGQNGVDLTVLTRFGMRPEQALQVPKSVAACASAGIMQYFFAPLERKGFWDIYAVDEMNEVSIYRNYCGSRSELVNAINRFCTRRTEDLTEHTMNFNLPQYFVLSQDRSCLHPFSIKQRET